MPTINSFGVPIVILSSVDDIFIDMVEQVTVIEDNMVTQNPVETGVNISDHVVSLPVRINISGRFIDAPLSTGGVSFFNPAQAFFTATATGFRGGLSVQKWNALESLRKRRTPFSVVVQQGTYDNLVIKSLQAPRAKGDGTSMRFQIEMMEIKQTDVLALVGADGIPLEAQPTQDLGTQPMQGL